MLFMQLVLDLAICTAVHRCADSGSTPMRNSGFVVVLTLYTVQRLFKRAIFLDLSYAHRKVRSYGKILGGSCARTLLGNQIYDTQSS